MIILAVKKSPRSMMLKMANVVLAALITLTPLQANALSAPEQGAVRVIGVPGNQLQGRLEIYINGTIKGPWGTVCNDGFNINTVIVVCRQLGGKGIYNRQKCMHMEVVTNFS